MVLPKLVYLLSVPIMKLNYLQTCMVLTVGPLAHLSVMAETVVKQKIAAKTAKSLELMLISGYLKSRHERGDCIYIILGLV